MLYFINFSFIAYFGDKLTYVDIYLFFTHITETLYTLVSIFNLLVIPFIMTIIVTLVIYKIKISKVKYTFKVLIIVVLISLFLIPKVNDVSFLLIKEIIKTNKLFSTKEQVINIHKEIKPITQTNFNIILVLGESMRAKEFLDNKYDIFESYNYKTIYSGAINTDVSVPLLLNGALRPNEIDISKNLFYLAKKNNYYTTFISSQTTKSLQYIKPYLNIDSIDNYKVLNSLDNLLIDNLNSIDFNKNNFIVFQMQGEHSPYIYYPNSSKSISLIARYKKSMDYSNQILKDLINTIKIKSNKPYLFIFTSDHGELIGVNGKYGHNRFEEEIYRVPFIYTSNTNRNFNNIQSHNDIYQNIYHYLGYSNKIIYQRPIKIYGTMITEEDGYITKK